MKKIILITILVLTLGFIGKFIWDHIPDAGGFCHAISDTHADGLKSSLPNGCPAPSVKIDLDNLISFVSTHSNELLILDNAYDGSKVYPLFRFSNSSERFEVINGAFDPKNSSECIADINSYSTNCKSQYITQYTHCPVSCFQSALVDYKNNHDVTYLTLTYVINRSIPEVFDAEDNEGKLITISEFFKANGERVAARDMNTICPNQCN